MFSQDFGFVVSIADDSEILAKHLSQYKLIVLTNCGALPASLRGKARENLTRYLRSGGALRSEEHTLNSSYLVISYAVFCLKKKKRPLKKARIADDEPGAAYESLMQFAG